MVLVGGGTKADVEFTIRSIEQALDNTELGRIAI